MDEEAQAALVDSEYVSNLAVGEKDDRRIHLLLEMYNEAFTLLGEDEVRKCKHNVLKMIKALEGSYGNEYDGNEPDGNESDGNESDGSSSGSDESDESDAGGNEKRSIDSSDEEADDTEEDEDTKLRKELAAMQELYMIGEKYKDPQALNAVLDFMSQDIANFVEQGERNKTIRVEGYWFKPGIERDSEGWRIFHQVKDEKWVRESIFESESAAITPEEMKKTPKSYKKYLKRQKYWTFLRESYEIQATMDDDSL